MPERISLFGITTLPAFYLQFFEELARGTELHLFVMRPTPEWWGDIRSAREESRARRKASDSPQLDLQFERANPLLASSGKLGREFLENVTELNPTREEEEFEEPTAGDAVDADPARHLSTARSDWERAARDFRSRRLAPIPFLPQPDARDGGAARPIARPFRAASRPEATRHRSDGAGHQNLRAFHRSGLRHCPRAAPNSFQHLRSRRPRGERRHRYFHAHSGGGREPIHRQPAWSQSWNRAPCSVASSWSMPTSKSFAPGSRKPASAGGSMRRNGQRSTCPTFAENSWRAGLDRLLLGYAVPARGEKLFEGILAYDKIEGSLAETLGRFVEFIESLFATASALQAPRTLLQWQETLRQISMRFLPGGRRTRAGAAPIAARDRFVRRNGRAFRPSRKRSRAMCSSRISSRPWLRPKAAPDFSPGKRPSARSSRCGPSLSASSAWSG